LAVEAVIGELVSGVIFPVSRENTGKFVEFRPIDDNIPAPSQWKFNDLAAEFPKRQNREDVCRNSERKAV